MTRAKKKIFPELTLTINKLSHDGRGIAEVDGKTTFIDGALPGETVRCKVTSQHRRYNEAKTLEVLTASEQRTTPPCEHFGICGGCSMQHLTMQDQLSFKQSVLLEQLYHFGNVKPEEVLPPMSGNTLGYRGKARLGVKHVPKKGKVLVGFREKQSHFLADIHQCAVLNPKVGTIIHVLSQLVESLSVFENIPQIEVAIGDDAAALIFRHLTALTEDDLTTLRLFGEKHALSIYLQPNPPELTHRIWPIQGSDKLTYSLPNYAITMSFHPLMFTQVNSEINPRMIDLAVTLLEIQPEDDVLDLFCGLGNFTLPIARFAKNVVGIEGSHDMAKIASENAANNKIDNTEFFASNLMKPSREEAWMQKRYQKILLDPPRTGAKEIIPYLPELGAERIVYVSCNPATLARDAGELVHQHGYQLKKVGIINMFPHTSHIEAIALFEK